MRGWRSWLMGMALVLLLVSGVRTRAHTDPSVVIQAARHGANGTVLPAPAEAGEYLIISGVPYHPDADVSPQPPISRPHKT